MDLENEVYSKHQVCKELETCFSVSPLEMLLHILIKIKIAGKSSDCTWSWIIGTAIQQFTGAINGGVQWSETGIWLCFNVVPLNMHRRELTLHVLLLHLWDRTWSAAPSSGVLSTGTWSESRGGHQGDQRNGTPLLWGKTETILQAEQSQEKTLGRPYSSLLAPKGVL